MDLNTDTINKKLLDNEIETSINNKFDKDNEDLIKNTNEVMKKAFNKAATGTKIALGIAGVVVVGMAALLCSYCLYNCTCLSPYLCSLLHQVFVSAQRAGEG